MEFRSNIISIYILMNIFFTLIIQKKLMIIEKKEKSDKKEDNEKINKLIKKINSSRY